MTEEQTNPAQGLEAQGWIRQFDIEAERLDEYVEVYESMGDEVRVVPMKPELIAKDECATCLLANCHRGEAHRWLYQYRIPIYHRMAGLFSRKSLYS